MFQFVINPLLGILLVFPSTTETTSPFPGSCQVSGKEEVADETPKRSTITLPNQSNTIRTGEKTTVETNKNRVSNASQVKTNTSKADVEKTDAGTADQKIVQRRTTRFPTYATINSKLPQPVGKLVLEGDQLLIEGNRKGALAKFDEAHEAAEKTTDNAAKRDAKASVYLKQANVFYSRGMETGDADLNKAKFLLQQAVKSDPNVALKSQVNLNLAAVQMKTGDPAGAARLLLNKEQCDWSTFDASQHYLLNYNVARAYSESNDASQAYEFYRKSLKLNPDFRQAAEQIRQLGMKSSLDKPHDLAVWTHRLLEVDYPSEATEMGRDVLRREEKNQTPAAIQGLCAILLAYAKQLEVRSLSEVDPLTEQQIQELLNLRNSFLGQDGANELILLTNGAFKIETAAIRRGRHSQLPQLNKIVDSADFHSETALKQALSRFTASCATRIVARAALTSKDNQQAVMQANDQALARFIVASGWDLSNFEVLRSLVWSTTRLSKDENAPLQKDLVTQIIDALFMEKVGIYQKQNKSTQDWENLMRIHILLGQLFQAQGIWQSDTYARSSTFQWEYAKNAEEKVRKARPTLRIPLIHENLAISYGKIGRASESTMTYFDAIEFYLNEGNTRDARRCFNALDQSKPPVTAMADRIARLEAKLKAAEAARGVKSSDPK